MNLISGVPRGTKRRFRARLENMRPGQIRDAAGKGAVCLLPLGVIEAESPDQPVGIDAARYDEAIEAVAKEEGRHRPSDMVLLPTGYPQRPGSRDRARSR